MLVLALATAGSNLFRLTLGSPSALSAAVRLVPADEGSAPWYAASSPCGFPFLRAWGRALDVDGGACGMAESTDEPGGAIGYKGEETGQSRIFAENETCRVAAGRRCV